MMLCGHLPFLLVALLQFSIKLLFFQYFFMMNDTAFVSILYIVYTSLWDRILPVFARTVAQTKHNQ